MAETEARAAAQKCRMDNAGGEPDDDDDDDDDTAEEGVEAGNSAVSPEESWPLDGADDDAGGGASGGAAGGGFGTLPALWKDGSSDDPGQAVSSMVQQMAEALPDAGTECAWCRLAARSG